MHAVQDERLHVRNKVFKRPKFPSRHSSVHLQSLSDTRNSLSTETISRSRPERGRPMELTPAFSCKHHDSRGALRQWQREEGQQNYDSDSDSSCGRPKRKKSFLFLCFNFRFPKSSNKRSPYQHREERTATTIATTATPKRRSVRGDESTTDIPDSNITTRSAAIECQDEAVERSLSASSPTSSFYSAVSRFTDEEGWKTVRSTDTLQSARHISSSFNRTEMPLTATDGDECLALDKDDAPHGALNNASGSDARVDGICLNSGGSVEAPLRSLCACGFDFHSFVYNPDFPLTTKPGIAPDSYEECLAISTACTGCWETIVERSESLDPQYRCLGLGMVKRTVLNRMAIPLTMFLEENDSILHCWIHTPLGIRHMRSNLYHQEALDDDPDAGKWTGTTSVVDFSISWYCDGKPVRALQQRRQNPSIGTSIETRCILPDPAEGKIMLFQFVMVPKGKAEQNKLKADRILKYTGPKS